ncbi:DUF4192 family protein [Nocardia amamiensis]|uniref:DUF4192 family protein n=1 Tax=Nocardia amamiensis TaxID=404578 RepID=UPI0033EE3EFB
MAALAVLMDERAVIDCLHATAVREAGDGRRIPVDTAHALYHRHHPAESATLLAYSPYLRGDGTLAVLALHTALAADPATSPPSYCARPSPPVWHRKNFGAWPPTARPPQRNSASQSVSRRPDPACM